MNRTYTKLIASAFAVAILLSCEKSTIDTPVDVQEEQVENQEQTFEFKSVSLSDNDVKSKRYTYLTGIVDTSYYYNVEDLYERVCGSILGTLEDLGFTQDDFNTVMNAVYSKNLYNLAARMFVNSGNGAKGRFEEYCFKYRTKSAEGKDIELTGVAVFPNYQTDGIFRHTIDALTLSHDHLKGHDDYVSKVATIEYLRAIYNQVVVLSDYEGYNFAYGVHPYVCYNELARQSIDCALAALELMDYVGLNMKRGYKTYNMGMSKGGGVAMATQRMLENTEPYAVRKKLDLCSTYCATGLYDFNGMMEYNIDKMIKGESTPEENLQMAWIAATVIYFDYISHKDAFTGVAGFTGLESFFSDDFYAVAQDNNVFGNPEMGWGTIQDVFENNGYCDIYKVLNPAFFKDGAFDKRNSLLKALFDVMDAENPTLGWTPRTALLMEHSYDDALSIYDVAIKDYTKLKYSIGIPNSKVNFNTYYDLDHNTMSGVGLVRMSVLENPAKPITYNLF